MRQTCVWSIWSRALGKLKIPQLVIADFEYREWFSICHRPFACLLLHITHQFPSRDALLVVFRMCLPIRHDKKSDLVPSHRKNTPIQIDVRPSENASLAKRYSKTNPRQPNEHNPNRPSDRNLPAFKQIKYESATLFIS